MKRFFISALLTIFSLSSAWAGDSIKVLILDKGFNSIPKEGEKLARLDSVQGRLTLGQTSYSGNIEVWKGEGGLYLINELPLEEYVEGVVKAETGKDWALEALKAQAVLVRTYVLQQRTQNGDKQYHVTSSVLHQVYKGKNSDTMVTDAVRQTEGEILVWEGQPIMAYYHSTSAGQTECSEAVFGKDYPYLKPVKASGRLSPYSMWTRRIPLKEMQEATETPGMVDVRIKTRTASGRADDIALLSPEEGGDTLSNKTVKAKDLRRMLGWKRLPSTDFDLRVEGDTVVFDGKGYGHGVGLCQWTALEMALEGKDYKEILSHFYPGTQLVSHEDIGF